MPCDSRADEECIFQKMFYMDTWTIKCSQPKQANWYAWHISAHQQLCEFYPTKCIFEATIEGLKIQTEDTFCRRPVDVKDPAAELKRLLKDGGNLKLAYTLMQDSLYDRTVLLFVAQRATWNLYTDQVHNFKTAENAFNYSLSLAGAKWCGSPYVLDNLNCLNNPDDLDTCGIAHGTSAYADELLMLSWQSIRWRGWSFSKHIVPPESCAGADSPDPNEALHTCQRMKQEYGNLIKFVKPLHAEGASPEHKTLWKDLAPITRPKPIRLLYEFYQRDQFRPNCEAGQHLLRGCLHTMCDNKSCEDVHNVLRIDQRDNPTSICNI